MHRYVRFGQFTANHGYEACSDAIGGQIHASGWSRGVQFRTAFQLVFQLNIRTNIDSINQ